MAIFNWSNPFKKQGTQNTFAEAFYKLIGNNVTAYDVDGKSYINKGYNLNSDVYSIVSQQATKTQSIPYFIKKIEDRSAKMRLKSLYTSTKGIYTPHQLIKKIQLEKKAYKDDNELPFPLDRPNPTQSWSEIFALYKTFLRVTGNAYFYMLRPEEGANRGTPIQVYVLPSHLMNIVVKDDIDMLGIETPIAYYTLIEGRQYIQFREEDVIHIKLANPNFDLNGSHLYGQSPLRAVLTNIQSSNEAVNNNIKILQNGGVFGFIHGKNVPLTQDQAKEIKDRLLEMDASPERLSKIAGVSAEMGFTRIALTTDELKPFDYLKYDQKSICNALGWDVKLLNESEGAKYDNYKSSMQRVITDNIMPDLNLLASAFNDSFLPLFKGYEGAIIEWDSSELPEMQTDMASLTGWLNQALDRGVISRDEYRSAIQYAEIETPEMTSYTVNMSTMLLEDALMQPDMGANLELDE